MGIYVDLSAWRGIWHSYMGITAPSETILECSEDDAKKIMAASKATVNIEDSP